MRSRPAPLPAETASADTHRVVPRAVARAIGLMRENLAHPLGIDAIVAVAGVPERTLRRQFKRFTGQSPTAYHRNMRLEAARSSLRSNSFDAEVTATAAKHGFDHFGRFAARYRRRFGELPSNTLRNACVTVMVPPPLATRELLTLTVLPFACDGDAAGETALAGALTDRVISVLGRMRWLDVMGTDTIGVREGVGPDRTVVPFDTRYAVRGRVRIINGRVQVAVRLYDAGSGRHIWGDAFEGQPEDALALQHHVIEGVAGRLPGYLRDAEAMQADRKPARDRTAHDLAMRAFRAAATLTQAANIRALEDIDRAMSIEPEFPLITALASWCHAQQAIYNFARALDTERDEARRLTSLALSQDDSDPLVLAVLGTSSTLIGDLDLAELLIGKCLAIDPYCGMAWQRRGWLATYRGRDTALEDFQRCLALTPSDPDNSNTLLGISTAHFLAGHYEQAADWAVRGIQERPSATWAYRIAAAAQVRSGRISEARYSTSRLLTGYPDLTIPSVIGALPMTPDFLTRFAEGLEAAGVPR
jgi:adenylate cyclase